jgi:hypothetical protein
MGWQPKLDLGPYNISAGQPAAYKFPLPTPGETLVEAPEFVLSPRRHLRSAAMVSYPPRSQSLFPFPSRSVLILFSPCYLRRLSSAATAAATSTAAAMSSTSAAPTAPSAAPRCVWIHWFPCVCPCSQRNTWCGLTAFVVDSAGQGDQEVPGEEHRGASGHQGRAGGLRSWR